MFRFLKVVLLSVCAVTLFSQSTPPTSLNVSSTVPPATKAFANNTSSGVYTYYYWVVGRFANNSYSGVSTPGAARNIAVVSGSNPVTVTWQPIPGANQYTVFKTLGSVFPGTTCTGCVLGTTTNLTLNDTGAALTSSSGLNPAAQSEVFSIQADSLSSSTPSLYYVVNGIRYNFGGGGGTGDVVGPASAVPNTIPIYADSTGKLLGTTGILSTDIARLSVSNLFTQANTFQGSSTFDGSLDARSSFSTFPFKTGTLASRPATCTVGSMYYATNGTPGKDTYICRTTNTWSVLGLNSPVSTVVNNIPVFNSTNGSGLADSGISISSLGDSMANLPVNTSVLASQTSVLQFMTTMVVGTIGVCYVNTTTSQPASGNLVVTLTKNGVPTALTTTIAASAPAAAYLLSGTDAFSIPDVYAVSLVNNATALSANIGAVTCRVKIN